MIELTKTTREDLETLFVFQTNKDGIWMAAFTPKDPHDKEFYIKKWTMIIENPDIMMQTIRFENKIVGSIVHFDMMEETNVSYWIDQQYWGKGFATEGLKAFIKGCTKRPLIGRVAYDNYGSQRVLEKCGFTSIRKGKGFANVRNEEIEELVYKFE
jgi:ribosomal-protein-alanine N-acetyltransferase